MRDLAPLVLTGLLCAVGCRKEEAVSRPPTCPVTGKITLGGDPLPDATVRFEPVDGPWTASGVTGPDGRYVLSTFQPGDGAVPGEYRVAVVDYRGSEQDGTWHQGSPNYFPVEDLSPEETEPLPLLPPTYASPDTSGLTATVGPGGENVVDIKLHSEHQAGG